MELQDFAPHLLLAQVVFKEPSPAVIDQRGAWITTLGEKFGATEFSAEAAAVEAFSEDKRKQYRVGTMQVVASVENFDEIERVGKELGEFVDVALTRVNRPRVAQVRVKTYDLAPTDSFDELRDALAASLLTPTQKLAEIVGKPMSDVGWVMEFLGSNPNITVRFGPMKIDQIKTMLRDERDSQYPEQFLFLDLDYLQEGEDLDVDQAVARLAKGIESNRHVVRHVADWLRETLTP